jgi:hypothetical protein
MAQLRGSKPMKRNPFLRRPITYNSKRPRSKAEEPDHLFRWNPPFIMITTHSLKGGDIILFNAFILVIVI